MVVARVFDQVLHRSELVERMPDVYGEADSIRLADQIINNWIREKVVLNLADKNLSDEQKNFTTELNDYKNSLIIYAYERELIRQKLDTNITDDEIEAYYQEHLRNFTLESIIVQLRFVKLSVDAPKREKLENWFRSDDPEDFDKLYEYCRKYAENYFFEEGSWLYLEDFLREVPMPVEDWDEFLKNTSYYAFESDAHLYLVRFYDYGLRGETAPMPLVKNQIEDLILNRRKVELIKEMREEAVNEAYAKDKVEWQK